MKEVAGGLVDHIGGRGVPGDERATTGVCGVASTSARCQHAGMSSYAAALKVQLAEYKRQQLLITEDGLYAKNGKPYPHILPAAVADLNLCGPLRRELLDVIRAHPSWKKHRDFHHLNSSQAMCWNVMMPALLLPDGLEHLRVAMGLPVSVRDVDFEVILDTAEFTNFDSILELEGGGTVYIEAKLTESEFGTAKKNCERERKRTGTYVPRLLGKVPALMLEEPAFYAHYQLLRNLSYLSTATDHLVLLIPRASKDLVSQAESFLSCIEAPWRDQVSLVFIEHLIQDLAQLTDGKCRLHYLECQRKYILNRPGNRGGPLG